MSRTMAQRYIQDKVLGSLKAGSVLASGYNIADTKRVNYGSLCTGD